MITNIAMLYQYFNLETQLKILWRKSLAAITQESSEQYWTSPGGCTPTMQQLYGHLPPITKTIKVRRTRHAGNCWRSRDEITVMYSCGPLHMDGQKQSDQLEPTYNSSLSIQDVALKTCRKQWTIEKGGWKGSGIFVLLLLKKYWY